MVSNSTHNYQPKENLSRISNSESINNDSIISKSYVQNMISLIPHSDAANQHDTSISSNHLNNQMSLKESSQVS